MSASRLTGFGSTARHLAESRGLEQWTAIHRAVLDAGGTWSRPQMMNYYRGNQPTPEELVLCLAKALDLTEEEKRTLSYAWAYQQNKEDDEEPKTAVHKVAAALKWTEEECKEYAYQYLFRLSSMAITA